MTLEEIWIPIKGYEGELDISNTGKVRSYKKVGGNGDLNDIPKLLKISLDGRGYCHVTGKMIGKKKVLLVIHRQVAIHFIANPENYKIVRHLNDIKNDNRVENLAWGTFKDNRQDGIANGTQFHEKGKRAVQRKLDETKVKEIWERSENNCELGRIYGVTESTISKIKLGRTWNHVTGLKRIK